MCDVIEMHGNVCVVMPKLKMGLDDTVQSKVLDRQKKVKIAHGLLSVLCFLHDNGMIHRDVKSANVMLDDKYLVQLIDFSLAKLIPTKIIDNQKRTHTPDVGTACYIAPEVYRKQPYGFKADAYSAGVVLLEMFSGEKLGTDRDKAAITLVQKKKDNLPGNDKPVPALLRALLEEEPKDRLTVREVLGDSSVDLDEKRDTIMKTITKLWSKNKFPNAPPAEEQRIIEQALSSLVDVAEDVDALSKKNQKRSKSQLTLLRIKKACSVLESESEATERAAIRYAKSTEHVIGDEAIQPEHCVLLAMKMNEDDIPGLEESIEVLSYECNDIRYDIDEYLAAEKKIFECMNYCLFVNPTVPKTQGKKKNKGADSRR